MRRLTWFILLIMVVGVATAVARPTTAHTTTAVNIPFAIDAAADSCESATLIPSLPWGDQTLNIGQFTESPTDPVLGCMWGNPSRPQGYRTAWYRFVAPYSAKVTVNTFFSTYDTVVAVYSGSCGALTQLACNDDHQGFTSRVTVPVRRGETYYIQVADWHFDVYGTSLSVSVLIEPAVSSWQFQGNMSLPRSRHALVAVGKYLYVIGGETEMGISPTLTSSLQRLDTETGEWTNLQAMPGIGYANSSAAVVGGKIYLPSGFTGNTSAYNGTHRVYDIATDFWSTSTTAPWPDGRPLAWGTAVTPQGPFPPFPGYFYVGGTPDQPPIEAHSNTVAVPSRSVLFFNTANNLWTGALIPELTVGRFAHAAAWVGNRLCVVGGLGINDAGTSNILLTDGECYRSGIGWQAIGALNVPRYNAGSAIGPDGHWYIFGGLSGTSEPVDVTEVYNPTTNTWHAMPINYSLGGTIANPARAWPRGAFVGNNLWVMGGNMGGAVGPVLPMVEKLFLPRPTLFLPLVTTPDTPLPNDTLATAVPIWPNQPQFHTFDNNTDYADTYFFDLGENRTVIARLSDIPVSGNSPSNYDLFLYDSNKVLRGSSQNPGNLAETINVNLSAGRYYLLVKRIYPAGDPDTSPYRIEIELP